jgi:hypothetical protein
MKRLIYLKKWTIVRPSCFAPVHVQIVVLGSFFIILDYFSLFFYSTYPVNSIAKEIFWAVIYRGRPFILGPIVILSFGIEWTIGV